MFITQGTWKSCLIIFSFNKHSFVLDYVQKASLGNIKITKTWFFHPGSVGVGEMNTQCEEAKLHA
jgi:hypothetical protein